MKHPLFLSLIMATAVTGTPALAFDLESGKDLVNTNCYECHGDEIYTRKDRRVSSRQGLTTQVNRCELALGLKWFEEDVGDAAAYLNQNFYKFGK